MRLSDDQAISSLYIRERFGWDRMSDVNWELVRNNYESVCRILLNPDRFPKADFAAVETAQIELASFLMLSLRVVSSELRNR